VAGEEKYNLAVEIKDKSLVPRFSAIILDNIQIKDSPAYIKERLEAVGTRALNNVIDITNYLMFDKGQPMHAFDYDKILGAKMTVRESKKGEKIITLDSVERELPAGVIVIEDGEGRLIDLCGIMGAKNSEVDEGTRRVLLFVQVYDPVRIRKSSMALGHRTEAALIFPEWCRLYGRRWNFCRKKPARAWRAN
jgi:phenylalanyl-tRNA synthetase beta chain